jgi:hypothetical protein
MRRLIRILTALSILAGVIATLSYGSGAQIAVRYVDPPLGAWWDTNEFLIMKCSAAALGMLIAIRLAARFIEHRLRPVALGWSLAICALLLIPVANVSARLARIGADGQGGPVSDWLTGHFGYGTGIVLDKIFLAVVYFLKTAGFSLVAGLGIFALILAAVTTLQRSGAPAVESQEREASPQQ